MEQKIEMVVFDWAGTTVDYGSSAPVDVFDKVFKNEGIYLTKEQINEPMGMEKKTHIRQLLSMTEVNKQWKSLKNAEWTEDDIERLYENFEKSLAEVVAEYSIPIEGVVETVDQLKNRGLKIGSTTGYTSEMMENVATGANKAGYSPDCIVTPDIAGGSRPSPFMVFEAMKQLNVYSPKAVVKVGDTLSDIKEGNNAGTWSVGLLEGSNLLGLTKEEYDAMDKDELKQLKDQTAVKYYNTGADFVIDNIKELPSLIDHINRSYEEDRSDAPELNQFYNPVSVYQGPGSLYELPALLESMENTQRLLVIAWDESVFNLDVFRSLKQNELFAIEEVVFDQSNPTVDDLLRLINETKEFNADLVITVGGGSVMDIGKSLCLIYEHSIHTIDDVRNIIDEKNYKQPTTKWIGIPTTAGTGSEVTKWATIWDPKIDKKRSVTSSMNYAHTAIVDPKLSENVPLTAAMSSALDAAAHAAESYWSKKTNITSRAIALTAISKVMENIDCLVKEETAGMNELTQGSNLAGLAFSNTQTTACHAISYPLTMRYGISHGAAVSLLIAPVMEFNEKSIPEKDLLFKAFGVRSTDELRLRINNLLEQASIPTRLRDFGIKKEDLDELAELAHTKGISENNPVAIGKEDIFELLNAIY